MTRLLDEFGFDVVDAGPLKEGWRIQRDIRARSTSHSGAIAHRPRGGKAGTRTSSPKRRPSGRPADPYAEVPVDASSPSFRNRRRTTVNAECCFRTPSAYETLLAASPNTATGALHGA